jgi:hypothetical protein
LNAVRIINDPIDAGIAKIKNVNFVPNLCLMRPDGMHEMAAPSDITPTTIPYSFFDTRNGKFSFSTICELDGDDHAIVAPK